MTYEIWLELKKEVNLKCDEAEKELKKLTGKIEGNFGLIPDVLRNSDEYKALKREFDFRFKELRYFNSEKQYKKHQKKYQEEKRKKIPRR